MSNQKEPITSFAGVHHFLSNFFMTPVPYEGDKKWPNSLVEAYRKRHPHIVAKWVDLETGGPRVTPRPAPHKKPPPFAKD